MNTNKICPIMSKPILEKSYYDGYKDIWEPNLFRVTCNSDCVAFELQEWPKQTTVRCHMMHADVLTIIKKDKINKSTIDILNEESK